MSKEAQKGPASGIGVPEASFDERLGRLEALVLELEDKKLGLEPAIARYQEGIELLKSCHEQLAGFRARVEELTRDAEGGLRPFPGDPDDPGPSEAARDSQAARDQGA